MGYTYDKSRASKERVWSSLQAPASTVAKDLLSDPTGLNKITESTRAESKFPSNELLLFGAKFSLLAEFGSKLFF